MFYIKQLVRLSIFIHADIFVPVSEFVVVAVLSEWWLVPTTADQCGYILLYWENKKEIRDTLPFNTID